MHASARRTPTAAAAGRGTRMRATSSDWPAVSPGGGGGWTPRYAVPGQRFPQHLPTSPARRQFFEGSGFLKCRTILDIHRVERTAISSSRGGQRYSRCVEQKILGHGQTDRQTTPACTGKTYLARTERPPRSEHVQQVRRVAAEHLCWRGTRRPADG